MFVEDYESIWVHWSRRNDTNDIEVVLEVIIKSVYSHLINYDAI